MMRALMNATKAAAQQEGQGRAATRHGTVSGYDPSAYAVKVALQPDGVLTGWIPLKSAWIGNGWGMFCPPSIGDAVELNFQEDDGGVGCVGWRFYNDQDRPLPCPSGEFWLVHKNGAVLKFKNGGEVILSTPGTLTTQAAQWNHTGPVHIDGDVTVHGDVTADGISLKTHKHTGIQPGGAKTGAPG